MARTYLKGLPQLKAKLNRIRRETSTEVAEAMGKAADEVVEMMKRLVPVKTGKLRDSIGWTFGQAPKGSIRVATYKQGLLQLTIYAGDEEAFWARFVEFGTQGHEQLGKFIGTKHPGTTGQPFFFPSYRAMRKEIKKKIRLAISEAIKKSIK